MTNLYNFKKLKYLSTLVLVISCLSLGAQNIYTYTYDDTGNRIQRNMVTLRLANPNGGNPNDGIGEYFDSEEESAKDLVIDKLQISLFPNPTASEGNLAFSTTDQFTEEVRIISSRGELLYKKQDIIGDFTLPFSNLPVGSYFVCLKLNGKVERFQVIKE
jgi:hypothetical protein